MINKKVCMLGAFSVGKTSLVSQFVHSVFSDRYLSTVGVKISKKEIMTCGKEINLLLWDMEGKDAYVDINTSYLRGAMGFFVVADGTRKETLDIALELREIAFKYLGKPLPNKLLINKADIRNKWEITPEMLEGLREKRIDFFCTSAKSGDTVDDAFKSLTEEMLQEQNSAK
ncbi:MAG: GTP-binding protein [Candidatus Accumulibacter sp.]|jgi:small GTP-binding protein|nr:GTP-binding protein [Accumulibacter sp.]